jgi:hypothetical protein
MSTTITSPKFRDRMRAQADQRTITELREHAETIVQFRYGTPAWRAISEAIARPSLGKLPVRERGETYQIAVWVSGNKLDTITAYGAQAALEIAKLCLVVYPGIAPSFIRTQYSVLPGDVTELALHNGATAVGGIGVYITSAFITG